LIIETVFYETSGDVVRKSKYAHSDITGVTIFQSGTVGLSSLYKLQKTPFAISVTVFILQTKKFLKCDWLRPVVFKPNLKYLHVKITASHVLL